jgi:hypothetical protein
MSAYRPENDETLETLAYRLRCLPPQPVPARLEGRLLAAIPRRQQMPYARSWLAAAVLLASAAGLLTAVRLPLGVVVEPPTSGIGTPPPAVAGNSPTLWTYEQALRPPDADASVVLDHIGPAFAWPVAGPATTFLSERNIGSLE